MKVIVCGSRKWRDRRAIEARLRLLVLRLHHDETLLVITGGAPGADTIADDVARELADGNAQLAIERKVIPAEWDVTDDTPGWAIRTTATGVATTSAPAACATG